MAKHLQFWRERAGGRLDATELLCCPCVHVYLETHLLFRPRRGSLRHFWGRPGVQLWARVTFFVGRKPEYLAVFWFCVCDG